MRVGRVGSRSAPFVVFGERFVLRDDALELIAIER